MASARSHQGNLASPRRRMKKMGEGVEYSYFIRQGRRERWGSQNPLPQLTRHGGGGAHPTRLDPTVCRGIVQQANYVD